MRIEYGKAWREFCKDGLNNAGTVVEIGGCDYLIGDANESGGGCECCSVISCDRVVTAYRVLENVYVNPQGE
jgi:hypothetical protein